METNPIVLLRERAGMSRREFATALRVPYQQLWQAESGYVERPRNILAALGRAGFDANAIAADYARWYSARVDAAAQKLVAAGGRGA